MVKEEGVRHHRELKRELGQSKRLEHTFIYRLLFMIIRITHLKKLKSHHFRLLVWFVLHF
jgi:hypothetical protein